ncbi:MAG: pallilysin-related adhesin [Treponema sp.]|jgi:hypothetical protein|nr:pallilysin-related adhesin [Treponema sp.]
MIRRTAGILTLVIFAIAALGIGVLAFFPSLWRTNKDREVHSTRVIIPRASGAAYQDLESPEERIAREKEISPKLALAAGEALINALTGNFDQDPREEQIIAYRRLSEIEGPVYLTYIDFDEAGRNYRRVWDAPTAATRPGTVSLYTKDLVGDRSVCVILAGMNGQGEHTLTVFRKNPEGEGKETGENHIFTKIAEIRIDGTITIQEAERTQAYQLGHVRGRSFSIAAYGRDYESGNILDQVERTYTYNGINGLYEQSKITRVPGTQIEQRRVRELLGGSPGTFEQFITGLWYYVSPQGTLDSRQYIYFDPPSRELIFYGDETQQVFTWQNSSATRYGLYISCQNISVTTLRRFLDIELESLDSIRVKVFEDVRLKIGVNAPWDGSYRKASLGEAKSRGAVPEHSFFDGVYDSPAGQFRFFSDGSYEINLDKSRRQGRYTFFYQGDQELLELRSGDPGGGRETFRIEDRSGVEGEAGSLRPAMTLIRVRIGARGIQDIHDGAISLLLSKRSGSGL